MTFAPTVQDIVMLADRINALALQGYRIALPDRAMDQIYSAVRGAPGRGLQIFQDALSAGVFARTNGDHWHFYVPKGGRRGRLLATENTPAGRPA